MELIFVTSRLITYYFVLVEHPLLILARDAQYRIFADIWYADISKAMIAENDILCQEHKVST